MTDDRSTGTYDAFKNDKREEHEFCPHCGTPTPNARVARWAYRESYRVTRIDGLRAEGVNDRTSGARGDELRRHQDNQRRERWSNDCENPNELMPEALARLQVLTDRGAKASPELVIQVAAEYSIVPLDLLRAWGARNG